MLYRGYSDLVVKNPVQDMVGKILEVVPSATTGIKVKLGRVTFYGRDGLLELFPKSISYLARSVLILNQDFLDFPRNLRVKSQGLHSFPTSFTSCS